MENFLLDVALDFGDAKEIVRQIEIAELLVLVVQELDGLGVLVDARERVVVGRFEFVGKFGQILPQAFANVGQTRVSRV